MKKRFVRFKFGRIIANCDALGNEIRCHGVIKHIQFSPHWLIIRVTLPFPTFFTLDGEKIDPYLDLMNSLIFLVFGSTFIKRITLTLKVND